MGDDIERLKIHKIKPRTTSDHVFLPVADVPHPPTEEISEAVGGSGEVPAEPIDPVALGIGRPTVRAGPDAEFVDTIDYTVDESRAPRFAEAVARYLPAIRPEHLTPDYSGIRPKLVGPEGGFADFVLEQPASQPGVVHLIGIESPGLTASLAIGARVSEVIG